MPIETPYHEFYDGDDMLTPENIPSPKQEKLVSEENKLIFPFLQTNPTSGSLAYKTMKLFCIPRDTFYVSSDPYGKKFNNVKSC